MDEETYERLAEAKAAEVRSLADLIETAAMEHLREQQFADDPGMAEIEANERIIFMTAASHRDSAH